MRYQYEGREYLGGWCRTEEKGRVVFLTPGHNIAAFRCAAYLIMIRKSAKWAIGELRPDPRVEKKTRHYTPEFKAAALAMMEEKGVVATVKELGISSYTLYDWKSKAEGQKYPRRQGPLSGKARTTPSITGWMRLALIVLALIIHARLLCTEKRARKQSWRNTGSQDQPCEIGLGKRELNCILQSTARSSKPLLSP